MGKLDGKVAVITGGAGMIGGAAVRLFAREGARVVAADIDDAEGERFVSEVRADGGDAAYVHCDVTDSAQVDALMTHAVELYGRIDVLHTNPYAIVAKPVADISDEDWRRTLDVTLDGVLRCSRSVLPHMLAGGGGSIVHTSSVNGVVISLDNSPAYAAAKAGVIGLCRSIARDYARRGVRCNALCPGDVKPRGVADSWPEGSIVDWQTAFGRSAYPEEIAEVALFLASDAASYITGATVMADCGWTGS